MPDNCHHSFEFFLLIFVLKSSEFSKKKPAIVGNKKLAVFLLLTLFCLFSIYISIFIQQEKIGNSISRLWLISETTLLFLFNLYLESCEKPGRTLFLVILCSIWAGLCRINWYFIPAGLGILFYFFGIAVQNKNYLKYFIWPAIWFTFGTIFAFLASSLYTYFSGNPSYYSVQPFILRYFGTDYFRIARMISGILLSAILIFLPIYLIVDSKKFRERLGIVRSSLVL